MNTNDLTNKQVRWDVEKNHAQHVDSSLKDVREEIMSRLTLLYQMKSEGKTVEIPEEITATVKIRI